MTQSGRQIAMQRLLEITKRSMVSDIERAAIFLERAEDVRKGNRSNRNVSKAKQASGSKRKAAKLDQPMGW
jgi:hypothetical protein